MLIQSASALCLVASLAAPAATEAQPYHAPKARRHFITVYAERQFVQGTGFDKHPLEELLGQEVDEVHLQSYQYRTKDTQTLVTVNEFGRRATAIGAIVYPFGSSVGPTLAIKGSLESIPNVRVSFTGPAPSPTYDLTGGRALDVGVGVDMSDRSPGWGLGTHAFVIGGVGRAIADQMSGKRYFIEGGGGVMFGALGFDVAFKYVSNAFTTPVDHSVRAIPVSVRLTLGF
jgi:hypothetical protein